MKNGFLILPEDERKLALDDAAVRLQMEPVILEKDFWVSWLLGLLFAAFQHLQRRAPMLLTRFTCCHPRQRSMPVP